jgi:hypothetical protein
MRSEVGKQDKKKQAQKLGWDKEKRKCVRKDERRDHGCIYEHNRKRREQVEREGFGEESRPEKMDRIKIF